MVQPLVKAAGKKESTNVPFFSAPSRLKLNDLPPIAAGALKSGALAPTASAARAGEVTAKAARAAKANRVFFIKNFLAGQSVQFGTNRPRKTPRSHSQLADIAPFP